MRESRHWPRIRCVVCETEFSPYKHSHRRQCCSDQCRRQHDEAKYVVKRTLSVADAAYLAGLVDGEGTISVWRERRRANATGWKYKTTFTIAQANQPYLESIRQMVGNGGIYRSRGVRPAHHKECFHLTFNAYQTQWLLPQIMPYLRIKRRQAELVLAYFASGDLGRRSAEGHEQRKSLYEECHELNRRGVV